MNILNEHDLNQLSAIRLQPRNKPRNRPLADASSRDKGLGLEFNDYQPFGPGDDIRHLDLHHYNKNRKLVVRQYDQHESVHYHLVIDLSNSMACLGSEKIEGTRQLCAALAFIILKNQFQVTVRSVGPVNQTRPFFGSGQWQPCLEFLESLPAGGNTEIGSVLQPLGVASRASDNLIIVSDFICSDGIEALKTVLSGIRPVCSLIRPFTEPEIDPRLHESVTLVDSELQSELPVVLSAQMIHNYQQQYDHYYGQLQRYAVQHDYYYHALPCEHPLIRRIEALAPNGMMAL